MFWPISLVFFIIITLTSDVLSKEYALAGQWHFWVLALLGYTVANIFWLWSIRSGSGLARGALIYLIADAVFVFIVGVYFYGEPTNKVQILGMVLGILSLILIF